MKFILQNDVFCKITNEITTPTGRKSNVQNVKYFYLIHRLNYIRLYRRDEYEIGVPMNYEVLESVLSVKPTKLKKIFKWLVDNMLIEKVKNYSVGYSSSLYKLHSSIESLPIDTFAISGTESKLVAKVNGHIDSLSMACEITNHQRNLMSKLHINACGREYLESKYEGLKDWTEINYKVAAPRDFVLLSLYLKEIYCRRNKNTKRVYSTFTNMPSNHREFLVLDGQPLYHVDLKNAQILLSIPKIIDAFNVMNGNNKPLTSDIIYFKYLAECGGFYEYLASKIEGDISNEKSRSAFKEMFFKQIFYSKSRKKLTKLKQVFEQEFPNVANAIKLIKHSDYRMFAILLQQFEAEIFIDETLRELYSLGIPALSIHDSIATTNIDDLITAENIITTALAKYGLTPTFKRSYNGSSRMAA